MGMLRWCVVFLMLSLSSILKAYVMESPDKCLVLELNPEGTSVCFDLKYRQGDKVVDVIKIPQVGLVAKSGRGKIDQAIAQFSQCHHVDDYMMLTGKKRHCHDEANEYTCLFKDTQGCDVRIVFRLYNDGLAFRYELDSLQDDKVYDELTTYRIKDGVRRWIQKFELGYEEYYHLQTSPSADIKHWIYPALVQPAENVYLLITEANITKGHSASSLKNEEISTDYKVTWAKTENEECSGHWESPWRVLIVGELEKIVESTLVTDVSDENKVPDASEWVMPGKASWVYWAHNRGSKDYQIVRTYIDLAHQLKLPYVLIDWEWDVMGNGGNIDDAVAYADSLGIKTLVWYNSSTAWTVGAGGPLFRLNKPDDREKEFAWLASKGIAGVKIDFFDGDTQATMDYCIDLLESAARHHLLVNFHGATIPRGWQRTYPNLMTVEAVYGAEWYNNTSKFTPQAARHNATLPFTRNVIGPMDYTPCAFSDSQHPHITTHAHELALTVLFESALQHLPDRPESYLAQPEQVQDFLSELPTVWDETQFISGYPGEWVAMARRSGKKWYVGVINGMDAPQKIDLSWDFLSKKKYKMTSFADDQRQPFGWTLGFSKRMKKGKLPETIELQPRGGWVFVLE